MVLFFLGVGIGAALGVGIAVYKGRSAKSQTLYHHTDKASAAKIAQSGEIRQSHAGKPRVDAAGKPCVDAAGKPRVDAAGKPRVDAAGKPRVDAAKKPRVDAAYGDGTYLTTLGPDRAEKSVLDNNYKKDKKDRLNQAEVAIEVPVRKSKVRKCPTKRDVYRYKGDLCLADVQGVHFHVRVSDKGYTTYTMDEFKRL